eukprot:scaffold76194_cov57-Phaeocystis_antarctica.AAC.1
MATGVRGGGHGHPNCIWLQAALHMVTGCITYGYRRARRRAWPRRRSSHPPPGPRRKGALRQGPADGAQAAPLTLTLTLTHHPSPGPGPGPGPSPSPSPYPHQVLKPRRGTASVGVLVASSLPEAKEMLEP